MFLDNSFGFRLELVDEFTKIIPSALGLLNMQTTPDNVLWQARKRWGTISGNSATNSNLKLEHL